LNRSFEVGLAEIAIRENVPLLAYSPLAFGVLTGKFLDGARPPQARVVRWSRFARYTGDIAETAVSKYVAIARKHGLDASQMALAFVNSRPFVGSTLTGATTLAQLRSNLASSELHLSGEVLSEIEQVHRMHTNPCP
jgi:aryl-alcohol dehydrogenase-like predicted oxidoreductase